jgi:hypothetical protein
MQPELVGEVHGVPGSLYAGILTPYKPLLVAFAGRLPKLGGYFLGKNHRTALWEVLALF